MARWSHHECGSDSSTAFIDIGVIMITVFSSRSDTHDLVLQVRAGQCIQCTERLIQQQHLGSMANARRADGDHVASMPPEIRLAVFVQRVAHVHQCSDVAGPILPFFLLKHSCLRQTLFTATGDVLDTPSARAAANGSGTPMLRSGPRIA